MAETTNIVQSLADDLLARALLVAGNTVGGIHVYDISDMLHERRKLPNLPGIFVVYRQGTTSSKKMMRYFFDLYILAGYDRTNRVDGQALIAGAGLVVDIRRAIVSGECDTTPVGRVWEFVEEAPVEIDANLVVYRQRWGVVAAQFC